MFNLFWEYFLTKLRLEIEQNIGILNDYQIKDPQWVQLNWKFSRLFFKCIGRRLGIVNDDLNVDNKCHSNIAHNLITIYVTTNI